MASTDVYIPLSTTALVPIEMTDAVTGVMELARIGGAKLVLVGAHALNRYVRKPRSSLDVDFLTDKPNAFLAGLPGFDLEDYPSVIRFKQNGQEAVDVIKPTHPLFRAILSRTDLVTKDDTFVFPTIEGVLALKFSSMISMGRDPGDKQQDAADFMNATRHSASRIDRAKLRELAELVYSGASAEMDGYVNDSLAGIPLKI